MKAEQMKHFIQNSPLVRVKEEDFHGDKVLVVKYSNKVFYKNLWTPEIEALRGVVLDKDYNIISNPFFKVFNHTENDTDIPRHHRVLAVEKINGFMAAATFYKDKLLISTTGTISSPFAELARKHIELREAALRLAANKLSNPTFIFEVCDPSDPHIINETHGLYLLGVREKRWEADQNMVSQRVLDLVAKELQCMRPYWRTHQSFQELLDLNKTVKHEGFIVYDIGGNRPDYYMGKAGPVFGTLKLKSPFYLAIKFLGRMADKNSDLLFENPESFKKKIDEEFYAIVDFIYNNKETFLTKTKEGRIEYIREFFLGN